MSDVTYEAEPASSGLRLSITGSGNVAKVALTGPRDGATSEQAATAVPTTFTLYANTNGKRTKLYSFKLSKWFIVRFGFTSNDGNGGNSGYNANYCSRYGAGYRFPTIAELTNANSDDSYYSFAWIGSLGSQGTKFYTRQIGGGLFAEWGNMAMLSNGRDYYPYTDFYKNSSSRISVWPAEQPLYPSYLAQIRIDDGQIYKSYLSADWVTFICVTP
ncbi:hypothetical protein PT273_09220 [Orbaceae bacterium ESL0727]|nr:hypothetical protein [Orbaceae bacterium ESL0727]